GAFQQAVHGPEFRRPRPAGGQGAGHGGTSLWGEARPFYPTLGDEFCHTLGDTTGNFSPDGKALGLRGPTCSVWEVATGKKVHELKKGEVLALSPDGNAVALPGPRSVRLMEVATGKELLQLLGRSGFVAAAFSPDGKTLAAVEMRPGEEG